MRNNFPKPVERMDIRLTSERKTNIVTFCRQHGLTQTQLILNAIDRYIAA